MRTRTARDDRDTRTREKKRFVRKPVQEKRQTDATKTSSASPKTVSSDDEEEESEIDVAKEIDAKKREEDCERATQANQKRKKKNANDVGVVSAKDGDALDPYAFENAKELFGKVDEVILIEDDEDDALDIEAEKYFENKRRKFSLTTQSMSSGQHEQVGATTTTRTSLFGKKKGEDTKKVATTTTTTRRDEVTPQKPSKRRVSFAKDDDYCDDGDKDDDDDDDDVIIISPNSNNSNKPKTEELFDEALAEEIKSTPEKSPVIAYKRKSSPSSQSQSPIPNQQQQQQPKKLQQKIQLLQQHHHQKMISQDPQAHLSILQEYSSNPLKKNSNLFESCLFLLKKVAGNTHYRRRLSNERPHFATTLFQSSLKIAGMSSTSKNLRLVSIALAYLFSLEIKTFSRFIDSMDISLAVAACLEESLSFHDDDDDDNDDDNNNDDEDKHKQDEDREREQKIKEDVQTSLQALKFLPNETSACMKNIALLLAFRALQWSDTTNEEDGGDGGGEDNIINIRKGGEEKLTAEEEEQSKNNKLIKNRPMFGGDGASRQLRTRLSRSGFMKSVAKLANESSRDLVRSIHNQKNEDETKEIARQSCARLFRCARIIEAATYASSETVTTLASIDLDSWSSSSTKEDVEEKKIVLEKGSNKNDDDDAFGDPAVVCPVETTTTTTATTMEKKKKKKELVLITRVLRQNNEEEEEKEEEKVVVVERTTTTTTKSEITTTTTTTKPIDIIVNSTTPERKKKNNNDDDSYNNNNFLLQIGSPGVLGASPIFGQMAKSPGAALDSWLEKGGDHEHHQQQQQQRASLKKKEEGDQNTSYTKTSLNNGHKWSLARSLIQVLPTLTYLTSRSMRPTSKNLHGINAEDFLNPSIDARLALATLKACIFALTNSTNENAIGARSATQHDGLHGLVASVAFYSVMRGCILFGESAGAPPKKNVMMQGTNLDAYKDAATEMLNATMCLLVNICEANPKAKRELLKLTLDCSSFNKEEKVIMTVKKENKTEAEAETASPKVPFSTLLARIFTHAGGARKNHISIDDDDENEEITADMLETHEDEGEDLITQAYASLLLAFLVEGDADALLRAKKTLPENGIVSIVETLERFHAFHDTLDAMSASSSESLRRVVSWLRSTYSVAVASSKHSR